MRRLFLAIASLLSFAASAQNWQSIYAHDTTLYSAGKMLDYYTYLIDSNMIRSTWIDSSVAGTGADSIHYFYRGLRLADTPAKGACIDTAAPTWLGPFMIRSADGTERYFNSKGDTITLKPQAAPGASWVLARSSNGRTFVGTVSAAGTRIIDGMADSVKTISIQAMYNSSPISDEYNNKVFELSKAHGWLRTLDLFRFPNELPRYTYFGSFPDSLQHERLPARLLRLDLNRADLPWKYTVGNEWITNYVFGVAPSRGANQILTRDLVTGILYTSLDSVIVTMQTDEYATLWTYLSTGGGWNRSMAKTSVVHTDTIVNRLPLKKVYSLPLYESTTAELVSGVSGNYFNKYFADNLCNGRLSFEEGKHSGEGFIYNGCWKYTNNVANYQNEVNSYVEGFGPRLQYAESHPLFAPSTLYSKKEVVYAYLNDCTWGQKFNVLSVAVPASPTVGNGNYKVYPNPFTAQILLSFNQLAQSDAVFTLSDLTGRTMLRQTVNAATGTAQLDAGFYRQECTCITLRKEAS